MKTEKYIMLVEIEFKDTSDALSLVRKEMRKIAKLDKSGRKIRIWRVMHLTEGYP